MALREGQTGTRKDGTRVIVRNGQIVPLMEAPQGTKARTDYAPNAYETQDGAILTPNKSGGVQVIRGAQTAGAETRARLGLSLGPMVEAQRTLAASERSAGGNPFNKDWGARALEAIPWDDGFAARLAGGQDYQDYEQAARTYESSILPLFSGAAVSPSEAKRLIRSDLPQLGDTPETLQRKAQNRQMRIEEAAKMMGQQNPFGNGQPGSSPDMPLDLSGGQSRATVPRGAYYRDAQGNVRRNDNGDRGNPVVRSQQAKGGGMKPIKQMSNDDLLRAAGLK